VAVDLMPAGDDGPPHRRAVCQDVPVPTCVPVRADAPAIAELTAEVVAEYAVRYDDPHDDIAPTAPDSTWLLVLDDDTAPVGCGAVQSWSHTVPDAPADVGELKRMYVRPAARGRGLSRLLLDGLVAVARDRGMTALVLETGTEQPEAIGLYTSYGFTPTQLWGPYRDDPRTRCLRLDLTD
jgi:GNAT superfamily N-acetyltransferase